MKGSQRAQTPNKCLKCLINASQTPHKRLKVKARTSNWIPAFAGMTKGRAATRDLGNLVEMKILKTEGMGKRDIHYVLIEPKMSRRRAE